MSSGKWLEQLVATIERAVGKDGLTVEVGEKRYLPSGTQEAEFDVVVRGSIGSGEFAWLIECRDRPSEGPAPGQWIEQLAGRRGRFKWNKVSAVSTTGFSEGAREAAKHFDIDLRSMESIDESEVRNWLHGADMEWIDRRCKVYAVRFLLPDGTPPDEMEGYRARLQLMRGGAAKLRTEDGSFQVTPEDVFRSVCQRDNLYDKATLNGDPVPLRLNVQLDITASPPAYLEFDGRLVAVSGLLLEGEVSRASQRIPIAKVLRYSPSDKDEPIAEIVSFGPVALSEEHIVSLEMHRMEHGTHILLRTLDAKAKSRDD